MQVGNCGPPIEIGEGWLVLTHGVGPVRTYSIGALLLDVDDLTVVIGRTSQPVPTPQTDEREGYVPNVVVHLRGAAPRRRAARPYGIADANVDSPLLDRCTPRCDGGTARALTAQ